MTDAQWEQLLQIINGEILEPMPVGFIIDSPWLPNWTGISILDYYSSDTLWFEANKKAVEQFNTVIFLPGFWAEYGMCSETSAFGVKCTFPLNEFPFAGKCIYSPEDIDRLDKPDIKNDGLLPFMINRLKLNRTNIEQLGHQIRFSISRGPLNIASFLMGTTEFLSLMMMDQSRIHQLLTIITDFLISWHDYQKEQFPSIDGILVLDDIIGFIGPDEFKTFALPYLKEIYQRNAAVKFLHNDAACTASLPFLAEIGINLFNMGFDVTLNELKAQTGNQITMLGNIPPRDVLAQGPPEKIKKSVIDLVNTLEDRSHVILSCGGGMPPGVSTNNIEAFIASAQYDNPM
jgi:uroporphyrinogen-III decarboxylase